MMKGATGGAWHAHEDEETGTENGTDGWTRLSSEGGFTGFTCTQGRESRP
jgi:hypothetical protein